MVPPPPRRRGGVLLGIGVAVVAVLVAAAIVIVGGRGSDTTTVAEGGSTSGGDEPTDELVLEPVGSAGPDPFTTSVTVREVTDFPSSVTAVVTERDAGASTDGQTGTLVTAAATPGLYGGTGDDVSCDAAALADFLEANPTIEAAWNGAITGLDPAGTSHFLASLTPVVLTSDTRVTNHGLVDGVAVPFQSVLQAGTAVLVDDRGVPVVKCSCGNPLAPPEPIDVRSASLAGSPWDTFRAEQVVTVQGAEQLESLTVVDTANGTLVAAPRPSTEGGDLELITTGTSLGIGEPRPEIGVRVDGQDFLLETPVEPLVQALTAALGPPDVDEAYDFMVGCGMEDDQEAVPGRRVAWGGLWFQAIAGNLASITMVGDDMASVVAVPEVVTEDPPWTTDTGLGIGSTTSDLGAVYPGYDRSSGLAGMSVSFSEGTDSINYLGLWLYMDTC